MPRCGRWRVRWRIVALLTGLACSAPGAGTEADDACLSALQGIAAGIERLKNRYPQLAAFSCREHCDGDRLTIDYGYRTHVPTHSGGWTAGVPNPDDDGVWFYIDFHDPASQRQIHTQPVVPRYRYRDKRVMFLILEGPRTDGISGALVQILRDNGVATGTSP